MAAKFHSFSQEGKLWDAFISNVRWNPLPFICPVLSYSCFFTLFTDIIFWPKHWAHLEKTSNQIKEGNKLLVCFFQQRSEWFCSFNTFLWWNGLFLTKIRLRLAIDCLFLHKNQSRRKRDSSPLKSKTHM